MTAQRHARLVIPQNAATDFLADVDLDEMFAEPQSISLPSGHHKPSLSDVVVPPELRGIPMEVLESFVLQTWKKQREDSLRQSGEWLCPCCGSTEAIRARTITRVMARFLIAAHTVYGTEWFKPSSLAFHHNVNVPGGDYAKLRFWDFLARAKDAAGAPAHHFRVEPAGIQFIYHGLQVRSEKVVFDNELQGEQGELVTIRDSLGELFDLDELLRRSIEDRESVISYINRKDKEEQDAKKKDVEVK